MPQRFIAFLILLLSATLLAPLSVGADTPPAPIQEEGEAFAYTLADFESVLGLRLGQACDDVVKTLGDTEYLFSYQNRRIISYNHKKQGIDFDSQCLDERIVSLGIRRVYKGKKKKRSKHAKTREAEVLGKVKRAALEGAFSAPAHAATTSLYRSLYYCTSQQNVLALHFEVGSDALHHILLIKPSQLPPTLASHVQCAAP